MIDRAKHLRLQGDLDEAYAALRGLTWEHDFQREHHMRLRADVFRISRSFPDGVNDRTEMSALLNLPAGKLERMGVDLPTARAAAAARERLRDLQRRIDDLQAQVTPLATLVGRLNQYARSA